MIKFLIILFVSLAGGVAYRFGGGFGPSITRFGDLLFFTLILVPFYWLLPWWMVLPAQIIMGVARSVAHGSSFDLGHTGGTYWVDFLNLTWQGTFLILPAIILLWVYLGSFPWLAVPFLFVKAVAYTIGWRIYDYLPDNGASWPDWIAPGTAIGEWLTGIFSWLFIIFALLIL